MTRIAKGDTVRLTGAFLRDTGQQAGPEGQKVWEVIDLKRGMAVVNEELDVSWYTEEELAEDPSLKWRRINLGNLEKTRRPR